VDDKAPALRSLLRATYEAQDLEKVVKYYEQLIALSGRPTPFELERLGSVYAQLGDLEKAREAWNRITQQDPEDPKSYITLARALSSNGFTDEGLAAKERALELDPYNYKLRFELAQEMASLDQPDRAIEQLELILEIGDTKAEEEEDSKERKVKRLNRNQDLYRRANMFNPAYRMSQRFYVGSRWRGRYEDFRPQVITAMANFAENSIGIDPFLEEFKKRVDERPENTDAKADLLLVYLTVNQMEDALKLAEELIPVRPNDIDLLEKTALIYSRNQQLDKAIELMEKIDELQPSQRKQTRIGLIALYMQNGQAERADELASSVLADYPNDYQIVTAVASIFQRMGQNEKVLDLYKNAKIDDPQYRLRNRYQLASTYQRVGQIEEALSVYEEMLFDEEPRSLAGYYGRPRARVYSPNPSQVFVQTWMIAGRVGYSLTRTGILQNMDTYQSIALAQLIQLGDEERKEGIFERIKQVADGYSTAESVKEKDRAWNMGKLLIAHRVENGDNDEALQILSAFEQAGMDNIEVSNLKIYLHQQQDDYDEMLREYEKLRERHPSRLRDILKARINTALLAENYEYAVEAIRELFLRSIPPREVVTVIRNLHRAGESESAKEILEEHLSSVGRNSDALALLADLHAVNDEYDKAIELAKEAWERKAHRTRSSYSQYSYYRYGGYRYYGSSSADPLLRKLHQYYKEAARTAELVSEFEDRLEKQPGSIRQYENLATLYKLNNETDKAIEIYQRLSKARPHHMQAKLSLADLLTQKRQFDKALDVYENLMVARTSAYRTVGWRIRDLYQRMGKGKELAEIEEKMIKKATNPNDIYQLAYNFQNQGEYGKAADLYAKAIKLEPSNTYYYSELADMYQEMGRIDLALETYARYINSPITRSQGWIYHGALSKMVGLYKAAGRLDELKEKNEKDLEEKTHDRISQAIRAHIMKHEKRFDEALQLFEEQMKTWSDPNVINELIQIAEIQGKPDEVLEFLEDRGQIQNYSDYSRLAKLYLAAGNREKAYEKWKLMPSRYGGGYGYTQAFNELMAHGLIEEAEDFYQTNRKQINDQYNANRMDRTVVFAYLTDKGFKQPIEDALQGRNKRQFLTTVQAIVRYGDGSSLAGRKILKPLIEKDPDNEELWHELAMSLRNGEEWEEAIPIYERLIGFDDRNDSYYREYANLLLQAGQEKKAIEVLTPWVEKRPNFHRISVLTDALKRTGQIRALHDLKEKVIETVDVSEKDRLQLHFAELEAELGDIEESLEALRSNFEKKGDGQSFQKYFQFLVQKGFDEEAYELLVENVDSGYFDRWASSDNYITLFLTHSDYANAVELAWKFVRYGDRYNRGNYLNQLVQSFGRFGRSKRFLKEFEGRVFEEDPVPPMMLKTLATSYSRVGDPGRALSLYDQVLELTPLDRNMRRGKADLLEEVNQLEERIELLKAMKGFVTFDQEAEDYVELAAAYFQADQREEGNNVVEELLDWSKTPRTQTALGNMYLELEEFENAIPHLEKGMQFEPHYRQAAIQLAKAYARVGRDEEAFNLWDKYAYHETFREFHRSLLQMESYELAARVMQRKVEMYPDDYQVYPLWAQTVVKSGQPGDFRVCFSKGYDYLPEKRREWLVEEYGTFLVENDLLETALEFDDLNQDLCLAKAIANAFQRVVGQGDPAIARNVRDQVIALPLDDAKSLLDLGDALSALNERETAAEMYRKVVQIGHLSSNEKERLAQGLINVEDFAGAMSVYDELIQAQPSLLGKNNTVYDPSRGPMP